MLEQKDGPVLEDFPEDAPAAFITDFLERPWPQNPREDVQLVDTLKYATEDLKSFYLEAAAAQPGRQADSA